MQSLQVNLGVDAGGIRVLMPQHGADLSERSTSAQHIAGKSVTKLVRSVCRGDNPCALQTVPNYRPNTACPKKSSNRRTSSGVIAPIPNLAISNALRLSLLGWSKSLSREVAREGITVNVVVPGRIATRRIFSG